MTASREASFRMTGSKLACGNCIKMHFGGMNRSSFLAKVERFIRVAKLEIFRLGKPEAKSEDDGA
jgi:hypothetical protein